MTEQIAGRVEGRTGRPLGFDPATALDRALEAFWTHGYDGTTTAVLEQATSLSRSSLLNTFGTKEQLLLAAMDRYQQMVEQTLLAPLESEGGLNAVERFFRQLGDLKAPGTPGASGCLVVNLVSELAQPSGQVQERMDRYRSRLAEAVTAALRAAAARRELPRCGLTGRAELLVALAVGINWTARAGGGRSADPLVRAVRDLLREWRAPADERGRAAVAT